LSYYKADNINFFRKIIGFGVVEEKSSHYGPYMLGFTCATRVKTMGCDSVSWSETLKIIKVRIVGWNSPAWSRNR